MTSRKEDYETELISVVAHDLKSPIGATRGFIELVENLGELNDQQQHFIERAMKALDRMEQLISTMLKFAEVESGLELSIDEVDLRLLIDEAVEMLTDIAAQRGITLTVTSVAGKSSVPCDSSLMSQVIHNLLANAIKYNTDNGQVNVRVTYQGPVMRVDVSDTGIGIPLEAQPKIFDRFYRAHRSRESLTRGSGLGLAISRAIVKMHDGDIWVDSTPDKGSTFSFTLPMHPGNAAKQSTEMKRQFRLFPSEQASEESDAVDDASQESSEYSDTESRRDAPNEF